MQSTQTPRTHCQHPDGCDKPIKAYGWCRPHHERIKKTGNPGPATVKKYKPLGRNCIIDACTNPVTKSGARGMCGKHYLRYRTHGDPNIVGVGGASLPQEKNPNWSGDNATYTAVHLRLASQRGPASKHPCTDCGAPASHWSFNGKVTANSRREGQLDYSVDLDDYDPRCVRCHSAFDQNLALIKGERP